MHYLGFSQHLKSVPESDIVHYIINHYPSHKLQGCSCLLQDHDAKTEDKATGDAAQWLYSLLISFSDF